MSIKKVKDFLEGLGLEDRLLEFKESSATVDLAAKAVGCEAKNIVKTLSFLIGDRAILICTPGDRKISNKKFRESFKVKAKMIAKEEVEALIGHGVGGVCPFSVNEGVNIYLDESLKDLSILYPAGGSSNSAVKLTLSELEALVKIKGYVDVTE